MRTGCGQAYRKCPYSDLSQNHQNPVVVFPACSSIVYPRETGRIAPLAIGHSDGQGSKLKQGLFSGLQAHYSENAATRNS